MKRTVRFLLLTGAVSEVGARRLLAKVKRGIAGVRLIKVGMFPDRSCEALTPRQAQVLREMALGATVKEIAARLGISQKTVETHRSQLTERLRIRRVSGLVRHAIQIGLVPASWLAERS